MTALGWFTSNCSKHLIKKEIVDIVSNIRSSCNI